MWVWSQSRGLLSRGGSPVATGYSGHAEGINNPDMQHVKSVGPLCRGLYTIGAPYQSPKVGPFALPLLPDKENAMAGRSDFRIHGDNDKGDQSASEGCIILPRKIREQIWTSSDKRLQVVE